MVIGALVFCALVYLWPDAFAARLGLPRSECRMVLTQFWRVVGDAPTTSRSHHVQDLAITTLVAS